MKVSGFTLIRNAIQFDFPVLESIASILPMVDEYVVNVGRSEDDTLNLIRSIGSPKIKIIETVWDDSLRTDGKLFGIQQDIALSHCTGDWAFLLQGDEVVHEDDLPVIRRAMEQYLPQQEVLALVFRVLHFKGDYWSLDPWMYHRATRIVRTDGRVRSAIDGFDFEVPGLPGVIKNGNLGKLIKARIFHYGYARNPGALREKRRYQIRRHEGDRLTEERIDAWAAMDAEFPDYGMLKNYSGSHPKVMEQRIQAARRLRPFRNRWLSLQFYRTVMQKGFRG